jgi:DNA polymerase III subunit epsilon
MPPFNMHLTEKAERCARRLDAMPDYRILRRLPRPDEIWCRSSPLPDLLSSTKIAVIDTETNGLDPDQHKIIELAVVKLTIDDIAGDLVDISPPQSWLEDPGVPLSPEIEALTGISDSDLAGQTFDDAAIAACFDDVDLVCAHNAKFDRGFFKKRFPGLGHPWACSFAEVDWTSHGLEGGRSVSSLLTAAGHFPEQAHRAVPDAWAVACLLAIPARDGRTIAVHLIERARRPTHKLYAVGAPFAFRDALKAGGYRLCATRRTWSLEAEPERIANEAKWLVALCPAILPKIERIDWYDRHAS